MCGVCGALKILLPVPERANESIRKPHRAPFLAGGSALDRMVGGQMDDRSAVRLSLVPPADRVAGPGPTSIMAAFIHHRAAFLARTVEEAIDVDLRWIQADLMDEPHDLRGQGAAGPALVDPMSYGASRALGRALRGKGSAGIAGDSVRHPRRKCVPGFKPRVLGRARAVGHIGPHRGGRAITHWFDKGAPHAP